MLCALVIPLLLPLFVSINADVHASVAELEDLLEAQQRTINDIEMYIQYQENILTNVKRYVNIFKREHEKAMEDIPNYMGNPINAFTLIKRLTADLSYINNIIRSGEEYTNKTQILHEDVKYPDLEDLVGAAQAIARLQRVYNLNASEFSEGKVKGFTYSTPMTASDCYELGGRLFWAGDGKYAREWMFEAFRKYHEEKVHYHFTDVDILDHINVTSYYLDNDDFTKALVWPQKVLDLVPEHPQAKEILEYFKTLLNTPKENVPQIEETKIQKLNETENGYLKKKRDKVYNAYEALCRGETHIPPELSNRLTCRYLSENHPFSLIAPFKIEMVYLNPDVYLFHDIVSDSEIETLMRNSKPKFTRALVHKNGSSVVHDVRTSKVAWFKEDDCEVTARITRRVQHMTGLSTEFADKLQVLNYGIGGHYEPHFDFYNMSDVAQGGATVFPYLGLKVTPVKGTAILWYNLHASGNGDTATRHAACPVLQGSKWVFTKWIREFGQEFIRPCNLENQKMDHYSSKMLQSENRTTSNKPKISPQSKS